MPDPRRKDPGADGGDACEEQAQGEGNAKQERSSTLAWRCLD